MIEFIIGALIVAMVYALSWVFCVGIMYLICLCFSWEFSLLIATGVWLVLCLIKVVFPSGKGGGE